MGGLFLASAASMSSSESMRPSTSLACGPLSKLMLAQIGLSPDALAAIGASDDQVRTILTAARSLCDTRAADFDGAQASVEEAQKRHAYFADRVRRGLANDQDRTALRSAQAALSDALSNRDVVLSQVQAAIDAALTQAQRQHLANIVAARDVEVPVHYKLTRRTDAEWVQLRDRLSEERRQEAANGTVMASRLAGDELNASELVANRRADVVALWQQTLTDR